MPRTYATVHTRSQHAKTSLSGDRGPDTYVAVTITPEGVALPPYLRRDILEKRGIEIHYFGEGYSRHTGPRSSLGKAVAEAEKYAARHNEAQERLAQTAIINNDAGATSAIQASGMEEMV